MEYDIFVAIGHIIVYFLVVIVVTIKLPRKRWRGNALLCSCLFIGASGGICTILKYLLELLSKVGLEILGGVIFYPSSIVIIIIMGRIGWNIGRKKS
jgi:hypothetical protein